MTVEMLGADRSAPEMTATLRGLTGGIEQLLNESRALVLQVANLRLALEIGVIQTYAEKILAMLKTRDPLCERVHLNKWQTPGLLFTSLAGGLLRRTGRKLGMSGQVSRA
jgi:hypothetical protein